MATATLEAKAYIIGIDKTTPVLDEIQRKIAMISKMSGEIGRASGAVGARGEVVAAMSQFAETERAVANLARAFSTVDAKAVSTAGAVERLAARFGELAAAAQRARGPSVPALPHHGARASFGRRLGHDILHSAKEITPLVAGGASFETLHGVKEAVTAGADIQSERARMSVAGIAPTEIAAADLQAADLAAKYPNVTRAAILESYKEARSVLLHPEETPAMLPTIVAAKSSMNALDKSGQLSSGLAFAVKGAEVLGITQDKDRFRSYLDSFIRAQQVMGKTITPEQQYEFAKYVKSSGVALSDRFRMTTAVSLAQEMGGSTTGQSIDQFTKQIIGGFQGNNHAAAKQFIALGLADQDDFETTKTGEIKGMKPGRKVKGADVAQHDPDRYVWDTLLPALEKHGITKVDDQIAMVRRMFPAGRAADFVAKLITQRASFENHAKLYGEAAGLAGGQELLKNDPSAALNALTTSLANFGGTVTSPIMQQAAGAMSSMASTIGAWGQSLAKWQTDHPDLAKLLGAGAIGGSLAGAGYFAYTAFTGLASGFGLKPAATELSKAAADLEVAAGHLNGGLSGTHAPSNDGKSPGLIGLGGRAITMGYLVYQLLNNEPKEPIPLVDQFNKWFEKTLPSWMQPGAFSKALSWPSLSGTWDRGTFHPSPSGYSQDFTLGSTGSFAARGKEMPPSHLGYLSDWDTHHVAPTPLGTYLSALSGKIEAAVKPDQITAKLDGHVTGEIALRLDLADGVKAAITAASGGQTEHFKLNLGTSSPGTEPGSQNNVGR